MVKTTGHATDSLSIACKTDAAARELPARLFEHVEVTVEAILGNCTVKVADLARLNPGDVLELDRQINEAVEIRVNSRVIGCGEIVAVGEKFAVRITRMG